MDILSMSNQGNKKANTAPPHDLLEKIRILSKSKSVEAQFPELANIDNKLSTYQATNKCQTSSKRLVCRKCSTPISAPTDSKYGGIGICTVFKCNVCHTERTISFQEGASVESIKCKICPSYSQNCITTLPHTIAGQQV